MALNSTPSQACLICEKPSSKLCGVCKSSAYCSQECQKKDWKIHKLLCKDFAAFDLSKRPSADHFRGILLPENDDKPTCVWMKYTVGDDCGYVFVQHIDPNTGVVNFGNDRIHRSAHVLKDQTLGRTLSEPVSFHHREDFMHDGSSVNKTILKIENILKTNKPPFWRGPVVVVGIVQPETWKPNRRDATMNDFRYAADGRRTYEPMPLQMSFGKKTMTLPNGDILDCSGFANVIWNY